MTDGGDAIALANPFIRLDPTSSDEERAREYLLHLLVKEADPRMVSWFSETIAKLKPSAEDRAQARAILLSFLVKESHYGTACTLAKAVMRLAPSTQDQERARAPLLSMLACETEAHCAYSLANALIHLDPPPEDQERARTVMLRMLAVETSHLREKLVDSVIQLRPKVADLIGSDRWRTPPPTELLVAARRNSDLSDWLAALPQFLVRS